MVGLRYEELAVIDNEGRTVILSIGEDIDGVTLTEIKADRIMMRDEAGRFEVLMQ